ncbi:Hybrid signal transduction histidine kinase K [Pseudocercospora fuligena]|uniref:Hybrid signal transduction histidine kinase K n=1 Tax=Pseudocercospora fuligena TaxID=685502 RepID=A0A8H6VIV8_9PEZI|nr:Hybrid signal transduction histidine kinase K [Pseudocercospora fuligena]
MNNKPSIFTASSSLTRKPIPPGPTSLDSPRTPRTSSPFRRQSTPDWLERNTVQAAVAAAQNPGAAPLAISIPAPAPSHLIRSHTNTPTQQQGKEGTASPSIWTSFADRNDTTTPSASTNARSASVSNGANHTTPTTHRAPSFLPSTPPASAPDRIKRKFAPELVPEDFGPTSEPVNKRAKLRPRTKHTLDFQNFGPPSFSHVVQPPSPLFFSNSPRPRPKLPPRFSSSEAAARMLSKARTEESHVKTVSLARGTVATPAVGLGPPSLGPTSNPQSRRSLDRSVTGRSSSPDTGSNGAREGMSGMSGMLNNIGTIELLEQDERPTFIVDLGDSTNYGAGPLHPVFANLSLRSYDGMQSLISGNTPGDSSPGPNTFLQFKSWLLSAAVNGESLNVCLPPFNYASMTWSCSTLRRRLRIISGAFNAPLPNQTAAMRVSVPPSENATTSAGTLAEPFDYFTGAVPGTKTTNSDGSSSTVTEVVPTIEPRQAETEPSANAQLRVPPEFDLSGATQLLPSHQTYVQSSPNTGSNVLTPGAMSTLSMSSAKESCVADNGVLDSVISTVAADAPSFDWTRLPVTDSMPRHIQFARSIDWGATALGPIETWSSDLRQMCNLIMASPHPAAMYWGEDLIAIYNEAYILLAGQKHPDLMGMSYRIAWAEIWDEVKDVFASAKTTGEATMKDDDCLFIKRSNSLEETYFSWSIIPMVGRDGSVMGLYNPAFEKTRRKVAERRMLTLREIGEKTASARDVKGFWSQVLESFEVNEYDSPFLLLYSVTDENESDTSSIHSNSVLSSRQCMLEGALGVPEGHQAASDQIDLKAGMEGFGPVFREVMKTDRPVLLEVGSRDLPESLLDGLEWRGFGDPVDAVVVCPIHPTTGDVVLGFLVLGVNPRRPYDDDYSLFIQLLSRQLATSLASVVLFEEEIRRGQKAAKLAALDRIELSEQLAARTQEAIDSETKFTRMAEFAPVGMFIASSEGRITFANDTWYDISRVPKNSEMADTWMNAVKPEDLDLVKRLWSDLAVDAKSVSREFRFKAQWQNRNGDSGDTWVLFSGYPEKYEDGRLKSIFGSITDISQQKWAEGIQTRKMEEAVELKRQQENFIDITSHEMRNPLSAILQCSDDITTSLTKFRQSDERVIPDSLLENCLDAAQTISLCSQHQKRIVDDILTLSKLDSQLLLVTPVDAQPLTVVQRALKMHEGELQAADIQMKFVVDQSFRDLDLDWVRFDPSRVLQVLINLTTNAIKFTGTESRRTITVTIGASTERPSDKHDAPVKYFPTRRKSKDIMTDKDWGEGEKLYIHFAVRDTGRGLSPEEKKLLFIRFSQASPRTHVQYGGSGLGLFISRELTELQGGEIGVDSEAGKGSTFAFYVAARRSSQPAETIDGAIGLKRSAAASNSRSKSTPAAAAPAKGASGAKSESRTKGQNPGVKKVLIVEDNLVNQKVLQKQLKNIGTEVHVANHGGEALEKLMQSTYWRDGNTVGDQIELGVVLMDQEMPVMDGLTCTRKIRELESQGKLVGHVPIIAVTANARSEQIQTALDAGMDDVVSKPFRIPELVPKIEELMAKYPMPSRTK